ncbi:hypothetical protein [Flexivirga caeni]|uniref:Uncharacterized protein n=1 Tax=Flexivirga caeni TaxID=2294115 RepID=A0A3M9M8U1_9MICO|nr:hypothetical protein [Flexivirga caeni]RNI21293.1 hypothetical protein EFY87_11400 [Flexivirga caeni]
MMSLHNGDSLGSALPGQLRRELTRALASTPRSPGLDRYVRWLQDAINRLTTGAQAQAVYDEWVDTHPRCARRAMHTGGRP